MKVHELKVQSRSNRKRVGRGIAGGQGKTAGRGTKGQGARAGANLRSTFEGGQTPLTARLPKLRGFKSKRPQAQLIHTDQLNKFKGSVTLADLKSAGLIANPALPVRLVNRGEVKVKVSVEVTGASASATKAVAAAGGEIKITPVQRRLPADKPIAKSKP